MVFHFFSSLSAQNALGHRSTKHTTVSQKNAQAGIVERSRLFKPLVYIISLDYIRSNLALSFGHRPPDSLRSTDPSHTHQSHCFETPEFTNNRPVSLSHSKVPVNIQSTSTTPRAPVYSSLGSPHITSSPPLDSLLHLRYHSHESIRYKT